MFLYVPSCSSMSLHVQLRWCACAAGVHLLLHVLHPLQDQRLQLQQAGAPRYCGASADAGE